MKLDPEAEINNLIAHVAALPHPKMDYTKMSPPDFAVIDLESPETNFFKLAKTINQIQGEVNWIFYGTRGKVETLEKLVKVPYSHLPAPLNPLVLLNRVKGLLAEDKIKMRQ